MWACVLVCEWRALHALLLSCVQVHACMYATCIVTLSTQVYVDACECIWSRSKKQYNGQVQFLYVNMAWTHS
jgi:hypothetical protein